jgi:hypothetical protein
MTRAFDRRTATYEIAHTITGRRLAHMVALRVIATE